MFDEFKEASYLQRYDLLCQKLIQEQLYTTASVITSQRTAARTGKFTELSPMTGLKTFVTSLAGHIAAESARLDYSGGSCWILHRARSIKRLANRKRHAFTTDHS